MTLTIHAVHPGDPRSACGEGRVFSGVPKFVNCEACKGIMLMSSTWIAGWYGINRAGGGWEPVTNPDGRHSLAALAARDEGASHVGYWNGSTWEDIESTKEANGG